MNEPPAANPAPIIIALSGPLRRKIIEEHILSTLGHPHSPASSWILYDLDERTCIQFSIAPMADDTFPPFIPPN